MHFVCIICNILISKLEGFSSCEILKSTLEVTKKFNILERIFFTVYIFRAFFLYVVCIVAIHKTEDFNFVNCCELREKVLFLVCILYVCFCIAVINSLEVLNCGEFF